MVFKSDRQRKGFFATRNFKRPTRPQITRMTKLPSNVTKFIGDEISRQRKEDRPQEQSIAIAFSKARRMFPAQESKLVPKNNPNGSQDRFRRLLFLLVGTAIALRILRDFRK